MIAEPKFRGVAMARTIKDRVGANDPGDQQVAVGKRSDQGPGLAAQLLEIGTRCAALPVLDPRSGDEILGYDEHGLPG